MARPAADDLPAASGRMFEEGLGRTHLSAPADLGAIVAESARHIGSDSLVVHLVDYEQRTLVPVPAPDVRDPQPLSVQGTVAGRAFAATTLLEVEAEGETG